jgi:rubrerythrin
MFSGDALDERYSVPHRIEIRLPQAKHPWSAPLDGWRCDLCGEIVTGQERPLTPPEKCPRCSSSHITSVEAWAARPRLGLWTR